jgi:hypothetical protein
VLFDSIKKQTWRSGHFLFVSSVGINNRSV